MTYEEKMINTMTIDKQEFKFQDFEARFFNPTNDVAFKKIFQHESLTISFLNSTLRLIDDRQIKTIEFLPTEQLPMTSESKKSILDVLCTDHRGFRYIIEVQNKYMNNYIQRVQYYVSHLYAEQLAKADNYLQLKPVTLLSLLNHSIFPKAVNYLSFHQNIEKETQVSYLNDMSYAFVELSKFVKTLDELVTAEDYWIYMMKHAPEMREAPRDAPEEVKQAYELLERHNWTSEERLAYEKAKIGLMDDLDTIRTARKEGREEGEQMGIVKGEQIGIAKGRQIELIEMAKKMLSKQRTINEIMELTELTREQIESL